MSAISVAKTRTANAEQVKTETWRDHLPHVIEDGPKFEGTDVAVENLFNYLNNGWNLYRFLEVFPTVSLEQALAEMDARVSADATRAIHSDRRTMGGTPVFKDTRLPVKSMFDHLAHGYSLDAFLRQFPTLNKKQALATLEAARVALEKEAYEATAG